jgi:uncharacterized membrane protein YqiK
MEHKKKAQGLSVNVIIIAAIALIILVVLVAVFTGRFGLFTQGVKESTKCEQACKAIGKVEGTMDKHDVVIPGIGDEDNPCYCK